MTALTSGIIQGAMILIGKLIKAGLEIRKNRKQIVMTIPCPRDIYDEDRFLQLLDKFYDVIDYDAIAEELTLVKGGTSRERKYRIPSRMIKKFLKTRKGWSEKKVACTKATLFEFTKWMRER